MVGRSAFTRSLTPGLGLEPQASHEMNPWVPHHEPRCAIRFY